MLQVIQHIYTIPLLTSALLSLRAFRRQWPLPYRIFSLLLFFVLAIELMAISWKYYHHYIGAGHRATSNLWLYNSLLVPQYLLYMAVYYHVLRSARIKKIILIAGVLLILTGIINPLFFQSIHSVNSVTLVMASAIIIFLTVTWFEQLRREEEQTPLITNPMAWISLGAFIFHAAFLPYIIGLNYLSNVNISLAIALFYVFLILNCVMYTLYSISFLCKATHLK
jgi:hypothetical protein